MSIIHFDKKKKKKFLKLKRETSKTDDTKINEKIKNKIKSQEYH